MLEYIWFLIKKSLKFSKKVIFIVATYVIIIIAFIVLSPQQTITHQGQQSLYIPTSIEKNQQKKELYVKMRCFLDEKYCSSQTEKKLAIQRTKSLGKFFSTITIMPYLYPPASFSTWAANSLQNAGFIPKTYATGIGFASIQTYSIIWLTFRNISFVLLVLVLVTIGFMVMFRMKVNPQTIVTLENSLPRIIVTIIMVTFSFAIAGLLIDLMYISTAIIVSIFSHINGLDAAKTSQEISSYLEANPATILGKLLGGRGLFKDVKTIFAIGPLMLDIFNRWWGALFRVAVVIPTTIFITLPMVNNAKIYNWLTDLISKIEGKLGILIADVAIASKIVHGIADLLIYGPEIILAVALAFILGPLLIGIIIFLTILFLAFRVLIMVLVAYVNIILLIIFSPLLIMFNAIPGNNAFSSWLKGLTVELLTFPILVTILLTGHTLLNVINVTSPNIFHPPFTKGMDPDALSLLISMTVLFMTPDLIKLAKKLLNPKPIPMPKFSPGVFFGGVGSLGSGFQTGMGFASTAAYIGPVAKILKNTLNIEFPHSGAIGGKK